VLASSHSIFTSQFDVSQLPSARLHLRPIGVICGETPHSTYAVRSLLARTHLALIMRPEPRFAPSLWSARLSAPTPVLLFDTPAPRR
jgi:hypothetical protein